MTRREKLATALLAPINPASVIILGVYTFVWGLWVANPFWEVFGRAPLFDVMNTIAPEVFWGLLAITVGLVVMYGAWKRSYWSLTFGAALGSWHWMMIATFYFLGDIYNTGGITSLAIGVYAAYVWLNLRVNFKYGKKSDEILLHNNH
jgi:hypothetical protein